VQSSSVCCAMLVILLRLSIEPRYTEARRLFQGRWHAQVVLLLHFSSQGI
jgi:hypothetical protein